MANWYFNADTGNDTTGDGSAATPYLTIDKCLSQITAGDTILPTADMTVTEESGSGYGIRVDVACIIDCTAYTVTYAPTSAAMNLMVDLTTASTIKGLNLDGTGVTKAAINYGFYVNSNDVTLEDSSIVDLTQAGQKSYGIYNNAKTGLTVDGVDITGDATAARDHYVFYGANGSEAVVRNVSWTWNGGANTDYPVYWQSTKNLVIEDSTLKITAARTTRGMFGSTTGAIILNRCTLWDSVAASTQGPIVTANIGSSGENITVNNCVLIGPNLVYITGATGDYSLQNNIYVPTVNTSGTYCVKFNDAGAPAQGTLDYNQYWVAGANTEYGVINVTDYASLADWQTATSQDANSQDGTPAFTDYAGGDYTLTASSACINQGVFVGNPYTGAAPDIGRYEYTASVDAGVGIAQLDRNDGTKQMLIVMSGTLYEVNMTTWALTPVGGGFTPSDTNYWSLISFSDTLWCINSGEVLHKWSGDDYTTGTVSVTAGSTTATGSGTAYSTNLGADGFFKVDLHGLWHRMASAGDATTITLATAYNGPTGTGLSYTATTYQPAGGSPPTGKILVKWDNRLWITGNSTNPRRIYFSALNDGEDWTVATNFVTTVDAPVSLVPMDSFLLVLARDRSWVIQSTEQVDTPYTVQEFTNVGCISHQSMAKDGSLIFGLTEEGVRIINGADNRILSEPIQDKLEATEKSRWQYAFGFIDKPKHRYNVLLTSSGGSQHNRLYAYDYVKNRWDSEDTLGIPYNCMGVVEDSSDVPHIYGLSYTGYLYEYETTATTDAGVAIGVVAESALIDGGDPTSLMRLMEVAVDADAGYTSVDIEHKPDGVATGSGTTSTLTAANSTKIAGGRDGVSAYPQAQNIATAFQQRLTHSAAEAFTCHGIGVGLVPLEGEDS